MNRKAILTIALTAFMAGSAVAADKPSHPMHHAAKKTAKPKGGDAMQADAMAPDAMAPDAMKPDAMKPAAAHPSAKKPMKKAH